jgi:transposase
LTKSRELIEKILKEKPDITLMEMKEKLASAKVTVSTSAIDRFLNYLGHSYEKNGTRQ